MIAAVDLFGFVVDEGAVALGAINGIVYGLLAVGLVLAHRSSRVINFAHGEVGAFAAAVMALVADRFSVPYWPALALALVIGAATSAAIEATVVRRLRDAPRVLTIVATLGAGAVLTALAFVVNAGAGIGTRYPQPSGLPTFQVGALVVTQARTGMLVLGPLAMAAVAIVLARSRYGIAIRAAAANPDSASVIGISPRRMATWSWAIAGALAALTAALVIPTRGAAIGEAFGAVLLVRALAAAVLARMTRIGVAAAAGVGIGIIEQVVGFNSDQAGAVEVVLFVVIGVALALQRQRSGREQERGVWNVTDALPALPDELEELWLVRNRGWVAAAVLVPLALLLPLVVTPPAAFTLTVICAFAVVGLSVGLLTGLLGQLTFGHFAIAAVSAAVGVRVSIGTGQFLAGVVAGAMVGAVTSLVVSLPGIRLRGAMLAVLTLGFALSSSWLLQREVLLGGGRSAGGATFGPWTVSGSRSYLYVGLGALLLALWATANLRRSWFGRRLVALRDNEDAARAFGVPAIATKVRAYAVAGAIAGLGGVVHGHAFSSIAATDYPVQSSIEVMALTVLGGVGTLVGPLLGALYIIGVPRFLPLDSAGIAASQAGWLLLVLYLPGGIAQAMRPLRDRLAWWYGAKAGLTRPDPDQTAATDTEAAGTDAADTIAVTAQARPDWGLVAADASRRGPASLQVRGATKSFGGVHAVAGVDLEIRPGEVVGLIGPNGAGKTTLFELIGGFTTPDAGTVLLDGEDVTALPPEARTARGLVRSFQDAGLFDTLTVREVLRLALESGRPASLLDATIGRTPGADDLDLRVDDLVGAAGLHPYRATQVGDLSTGTRRIVELACLSALRPRVLLLDEPSSGVAQREVEAMGPLIRRLASDLDTTVVVIEHDIPLIRSLADRLVVMASGTILAQGPPDEVLADPAVVAAYLGDSDVAVARSGAAT